MNHRNRRRDADRGVNRRTFLNRVGAGAIGGALAATGVADPRGVASARPNRQSAETESDDAGAGWRTLADVPIGVTQSAGAVFDGLLYSFGGTKDNQNVDHDPVVDSTFAYDPGADSWERKQDLLEPLKAAAAVAVGDVAYVFGGAEPEAPWNGCCLRDVIYRYDPAEGFAELDATHPGGSYGAKGAYDPARNLVYVAGGATDRTEDSDRVFAFDPETEEIVDERWATLPTPVRWPSVALVSTDEGDYLHAMGGIDYVSDGHSMNTEHVRYDLETGERESRAPLPQGAGKMTGDVVDGRIYVTHGLLGADGSQSGDRYKEEVWAYDPVEDSWTTDFPLLDADRARNVGAHGVVDGVLLNAGGHTKLYEGDGSHDVVPLTDGFAPGECES